MIKLDEIKNKVEVHQKKINELENKINELNILKGKLDVEEVILKEKISQQQNNKKEFDEVQKQLNELHKSYHEKGLEVLGISISDNKKQLKNFTKSFSVDYPLLYGGSKEMNKIIKDYGGVYAVPSSFLIGKEGSIIWKYPGAILKDYDPQTFATLIYEIDKELKELESDHKKIE